MFDIVILVVNNGAKEPLWLSLLHALPFFVSVFSVIAQVIGARCK